MNIYICLALLYLLLINTFENAYIFSICFFVTMLLSDIILSIFRNIIKPSLRVPISLIITSIIITIIEILVKKYIPGFYKDMGLYLPLIMLVIYDFESKRKITDSFKFTFIKSIKYIGTILVIALLKEFLATNRITLMSNLSPLTGYRAIYQILPKNNLIPMSLFSINAGSFILVGIIIAIMNKVKGGKNA